MELRGGSNNRRRERKELLPRFILLVEILHVYTRFINIDILLVKILHVSKRFINKDTSIFGQI